MTDFSLKSSDASAVLRFPWEDAPLPGQVHEVAEGILWLRMPLPFGLDHINLYLLRHEHGWVIVDTGLNTTQSREVWERVFVEVFGNAPVLAVVVTHFHHDHSGMAGWLAERFKCPVYMTVGEYQSLFISRPKSEDLPWAFTLFYQRCGLSSEQIASFYPILSSSSYKVDAPTSFRRLNEGSLLRIGDRTWKVVIGSGHSPEHACLYNERDGLLIAGDQVLPRITSSVCVVVTEPEANPLLDWMESISRLRVVPDSTLVLPAHERPFYGLHLRLQQLHRHHELHLQKVVSAINKSLTVAELQKVLFPKIKGSFDFMLAIGETLAHVNYLVEEGVLNRILDGEVYRYQVACISDPEQVFAEDLHV